MLVELEDGFEEALAAVVNISAARACSWKPTPTSSRASTSSSRSTSAPSSSPSRPRQRSCARPNPEREGIEGIGAQFLSFAGDSQKQLEAILGDAFRIPLDEVRTAS